jgi:hypothetical protein
MSQRNGGRHFHGWENTGHGKNAPMQDCGEPGE